jgi:hypothetical protein
MGSSTRTHGELRQKHYAERARREEEYPIINKILAMQPSTELPLPFEAIIPRVVFRLSPMHLRKHIALGLTFIFHNQQTITIYRFSLIIKNVIFSSISSTTKLIIITIAQVYNR